MDKRAVLLGLVVASLANISSFTATNRLSTGAINFCDASLLNVCCLCRAYDRDEGVKKGESFEKCYYPSDIARDISLKIENKLDSSLVKYHSRGGAAVSTQVKMGWHVCDLEVVFVICE